MKEKTLDFFEPETFVKVLKVTGKNLQGRGYSTWD